MIQYKCTFAIKYDENAKFRFEHIIYAENMEELNKKALKVFLYDQIEDETGLLDNAKIVEFERSAEIKES